MKKSLQLDPIKTLPWEPKLYEIDHPYPMSITIHEREVYINHNKVDQSFEEFASSIKNLVRESLNHIRRNKAHNMRQL